MTVTQQIRRIRVDMLYHQTDRQREIDMRRAQRIADHWDPKLLGVLHVALDEDGRGELLDGGHRWTAAKLRKERALPAVVYEGLTGPERARLFLALNGERKAVDKLTRFQVAVEAGMSPEIDIVAALAPRGLKVGGSASAGVIATVSGLLRVEREGGVETIGKTVDVLREAFSAYAGDAWQTDIFTGVGIVIARNPHIDLKRLSIKLQAMTPRNWLAEIANRSRGSGGSGGRPMHMAHAVVEFYNGGLRSDRSRISV